MKTTEEIREGVLRKEKDYRKKQATNRKMLGMGIASVVVLLIVPLCLALTLPGNRDNGANQSGGTDMSGHTPNTSANLIELEEEQTLAMLNEYLPNGLSFAPGALSGWRGAATTGEWDASKSHDNKYTEPGAPSMEDNFGYVVADIKAVKTGSIMVTPQQEPVGTQFNSPIGKARIAGDTAYFTLKNGYELQIFGVTTIGKALDRFNQILEKAAE